MTAIAIAGVTKTFPADPPVRALRDVTIDIASGELFAILGPSGCGKTTLLRTIAGFEQPDAGTVSFDGRTMSDAARVVAPERRGVGIVPQEGGLFPHLDVAANVAFGLRRLDRAARRRRVAEMLELVGLPTLARRRPHELSGGQQQRVALARALAPHPAVVLLDEPFAALDTAMRATLRDDVVAILRSIGTTAVLVTHDQAEALSMADTVAVMRDGAVTQIGAPEHVYQCPADLLTARLVGEAVVLRGDAAGGLVTTLLGTHRIRAGAPAGCGPVDVMVRPEQVRPCVQGMPADVTSVRFEGATCRVTLDVGGVELVARWRPSLLPPDGAGVSIGVDGTVMAYPRDAPTG